MFCQIKSILRRHFQCKRLNFHSLPAVKWAIWRCRNQFYWVGPIVLVIYNERDLVELVVLMLNNDHDLVGLTVLVVNKASYLVELTCTLHWSALYLVLLTVYCRCT